jgi:Lon protease-like protein
MTLGGERYVLRSYVQTDRLYRVALVEPFGDDAVEQNGLEALAAAVRREFVQLAEALAALQDAIAPPVELPRNPAEVSFHVAAALDIPVATKQRLLELRSPAVRLRYLREILHRLNQDVTSRVGVHLLVKRNGKAGSVAVDR